MKIIYAKELDFVPASHEDPKNPGVLKKVLVKAADLIHGKVQMINWALLPVDKSFAPHYHEDMEEVFIILSGVAIITVDDARAELSRGDAVIIPKLATHEMKNVGTEPVEYIALGITEGASGKTIVT